MPEAGARRPAWAGTLAFGLVTLPVELYPTVRRNSASLRMIDSDGTPLNRRYYSEKRGEILQQDDIVRGFEVSEGEFVLIEDEELDALDPERSRTMSLESFVPLEQIDPLLVDSTYLLVPKQEALPAYRLLVASMADAGRAGMAQFVLRDRSYHLALVSQAGTLRALTLRYPEEIRDPEEMGLPQPEAADVDEIEELERAMRKLEAEELDEARIQAKEPELLEKLVKNKLKAKKDVHKVQSDSDSDEDQGDLEDIMVLLRRSLEGGAAHEA